jgi:creatinine amidohydrolase/Fe(II)-dependent formamide hydrolase-like protein
MDKAVAGQDRVGKTMSSDSMTSVRFSDYWGRWTNTGVHGDPTKATPEKGKKILDILMKHMMAWLEEYRVWPIEKRQDMHRLPAQTDIRW